MLQFLKIQMDNDERDEATDKFQMMLKLYEISESDITWWKHIFELILLQNVTQIIINPYWNKVVLIQEIGKVKFYLKMGKITMEFEGF